MKSLVELEQIQSSKEETILDKLIVQYPELAKFIDHAGLDASLPVTRLSAGLSNANYLIDDALVLRVNKDVSELGLKREQEISCWRQASAAGLAPALLAVSPDYRFYLSRFLPDSSLSCYIPKQATTQPHNIPNLTEPVLEELNSSFAVDLLLELMLSLANLPIPEYQCTADEQWQKYQRELKALQETAKTQFINKDASTQKYGYSVSSFVKNCAALLAMDADIQHWLYLMSEGQGDKLQFCHRDLNPANILANDKGFVCIDFEYACAAEPLIELATVLVTHNLSNQEFLYLSKQYLDHLGLYQCQSHHLQAAINLYWVQSCCWALMQSYATKSQVYMDLFSGFFSLLPKHA